jgi:hypothetical protein
MMNSTLRAEGAAVTAPTWNAMKVVAKTMTRDTGFMSGQSDGLAAQAAFMIIPPWKAD